MNRKLKIEKPVDTETEKHRRKLVNSSQKNELGEKYAKEECAKQANMEKERSKKNNS